MTAPCVMTVCLRPLKISKEKIPLLLWNPSVPIFDYPPQRWWPMQVRQSYASSVTWRTDLVGRGQAWKPPGSFALCSRSCGSVLSRDVPLCARAPQEEELRTFWFHYIEFDFFASTLRPSDWSFWLFFFFYVDLKKTNFTVTPFITFYPHS